MLGDKDLRRTLAGVALVFVAGACGGDGALIIADGGDPGGSGGFGSGGSGSGGKSGGSGGRSGGGGSVGPLTIDRLAPELAQALCDGVFRCCKPADLAFPDRATCESDMADSIASGLADVLRALAKRRAAYDPASAGACVDRLRGAGCREIGALLAGDVTSTVPGCESIVQGKVATKGVCDSDLDCVAGHFCGDGCTRFPTAGQRCPDGRCAAGLFCSFNARETCVAKLPDGSPCDSTDECASGNCVFNPRSGRGVCGQLTACVGK